MAYVNVDTFLNAVSGKGGKYNLSKGQRVNFKQRMKGKSMQPKMEDFLPYLEKFIQNK